tara:strand:- start:144 stop:404 length:261 start_codon:yes stop_codon:yes gene_type:complete
MRAIGDNLIIQSLKQGTESTKGGLLLTHSQREDVRFNEAKVLHVGQDVKGIKENDQIFYDRVAGHIIEIDKEHYRVIKARDVVVVL